MNYQPKAIYGVVVDPKVVGGFDAWMVKVDAIIQKKCGLSYLDLPDYCYADEYEDGASPAEAAKAAIKAAGSF